MQFEQSSENRIYVQNGEIHTHGIGAPDLGLGAYRSAAIINHISGKSIYHLPKKNVFQHFGVADKWKQSINHGARSENDTVNTAAAH